MCSGYAQRSTGAGVCYLACSFYGLGCVGLLFGGSHAEVAPGFIVPDLARLSLAMLPTCFRCLRHLLQVLRSALFAALGRLSGEGGRILNSTPNALNLG